MCHESRLLSHTLAHTLAVTAHHSWTVKNTGHDATQHKEHTTRAAADGYRGCSTVAQWRRLGYSSATARLRLRLGSHMAPQLRVSAAGSATKRLMSGAATAGDGGDSDDGEATTPISRKMCPIAPTACHARTFHNMELCDEMITLLLASGPSLLPPGLGRV